MGESSPARIRASTPIEGHRCPRRDKIVPRKFGMVARVLWPGKTAAQLAFIASTDERTAKRWLRGEHEPPTNVMLACIVEMLRKQV